jgi:cell division protein FtsA
MASKSDFSVVIDLGTSKIAAFAGMENAESGRIEVTGVAKVPASGIKRGVVLNIEEASKAVMEVVDKLTDQTGRKPGKVDIAYAGQPVKIFEHKGYRYTSDEGIVSGSDIEELFEEAKNHNIEKDFEILHIIPQEFIVDGEVTEVNPVGIAGKKIEAAYKLITVPSSHLENINRVLERAGLEKGDVVYSPLALSEAILTEDEKEVGAVLLDIGAGTAKIAIYGNGIMLHTAVVPFGGEVITKDIKEGCSILPKWAEQLKVQYGEALGDFADERKIVTIPGHSGWEPKEISFKSLAYIIQARLEEIIDSVYYQIEESGAAEHVGSGIVITGGVAGLHNLVSLVKFRTGMDARIAFAVFRPESTIKNVIHPDYFTVLGLLKMQLTKNCTSRKERKRKVKKKKEGGFSPWLKGVVQGVLDYVDDDDDTVMK